MKVITQKSPLSGFRALFSSRQDHEWQVGPRRGSGGHGRDGLPYLFPGVTPPVPQGSGYKAINTPSSLAQPQLSARFWPLLLDAWTWPRSSPWQEGMAPDVPRPMTCLLCCSPAVRPQTSLSPLRTCVLTWKMGDEAAAPTPGKQWAERRGVHVDGECPCGGR